MSCKHGGPSPGPPLLALVVVLLLMTSTAPASGAAGPLLRAVPDTGGRNAYPDSVAWSENNSVAEGVGDWERGRPARAPRGLPPTTRFTATAYRFARPVLAWGAAGSAPGAFDTPIDIALGADGSVYVLDYGFTRTVDGVEQFGAARVLRFDRRGGFLGAWGAGELHRPIGLAVAADGDVWVADTFNHRIVRYGPAGDLRATWGRYGAALGELDRPTDLAFDAAGNLYVVEFGNQRVQVFAPSGAPLRFWGSEGSAPGQFRGPHGIALDRQGDVYVADTNNHRIAKFTATGVLLGLWISEPAQDPACPPAAIGQLCRPRHLAVDAAGNLLVADRNHHRIHVFSSDGQPLAVVGVEGSQPGQLQFPYAAAINADGDLYVADTGNQRVQLFALGAPLRSYLPVVRR